MTSKTLSIPERVTNTTKDGVCRGELRTESKIEFRAMNLTLNRYICRYR